MPRVVVEFTVIVSVDIAGLPALNCTVVGKRDAFGGVALVRTLETADVRLTMSPNLYREVSAISTGLSTLPEFGFRTVM